MSSSAPARFVDWLKNHRHEDPATGRVYLYHGRSDAHSKALCHAILRDLAAACRTLRDHARQRRVVHCVNAKHRWPKSGKTKTIDLAIGPGEPRPESRSNSEPTRAGRSAVASIPPPGRIDEVWIAVEAKSVMTEHVKAQPRLFDELSSSHAIVHDGNDSAIAAGIVVVNVAPRFASPLRQRPGQPIQWTVHKQPEVAERMVRHLRGLPIRSGIGQSGFDALALILVDCDNQSGAALCETPPAPQPGDRDHYDAFLRAISASYRDRFG